MYARTTVVSPEKSRAEIEGLLRRYGADQFISGWSDNKAMIGFRCKSRMVQFILPLPHPNDSRFHVLPRGARGGVYEERLGKWGQWRTPSQAAALHEQEIRRRWRALALVIKAKLEAVESGITTFEQEFLAHIVIPGGRTVGAEILPRLEEAYRTGKPVALLPEFTGGDV